MSQLIEELKGEHRAIVQMLNKVRQLGISSEEGQDLLIQAKNGLLAHLKKEDNKLYPVLNKAAIADNKLKSTMDFFARDMDTISEAALNFFSKYSNGGSGVEFAKEFGRLFITLSGRIQKEESVLYEEYNKQVQ